MKCIFSTVPKFIASMLCCFRRQEKTFFCVLDSRQPVILRWLCKLCAALCHAYAAHSFMQVQSHIKNCIYVYFRVVQQNYRKVRINTAAPISRRLPDATTSNCQSSVRHVTSSGVTKRLSQGDKTQVKGANNHKKR